MTVAEISADLDEALKRLDALAARDPFDPTTAASYVARIRFLISRVRQNIDMLPLTGSSDLVPGSIDAALAYFQSLDFGVELGRNVYITHLALPIPIDRDRLPLKLFHTDAFRRNIEAAVLATINDGRVDAGWMTAGGFDWEASDGWFEFRNSVRRGPPWQSIRVCATGLVAFRERWSNREAYPVTRFERFFEATLSFSERVFATFPGNVQNIALSSHLSNMRGVKLGVPGLFGPGSTFDMRSPKQLADDIDIPARPQVTQRDRLRSEGKELSSIQRRILESNYATSD